MSYSSTPPATDVNINITGDVTTNNSSATKHGWLPKLGGGTTNFLRADGTWAAPTTVAATTMTIGTDFPAAGKFTITLVGGGTSAFNTNGWDTNTSATATSSTDNTWAINASGSNGAVLGSPLVSINVGLITLGTDVHFFAGLGSVTVAGSGITFTTRHIGFKIVRASSGTNDLFGTQADGTTENATASLTTVAAGDWLDLILKINSTTSVDYYWRKNGGTLSAATNLTANMPADSLTAQQFEFGLSNRGVASATRFTYTGVSYTR